jgi:arsenate reductase-like glutaredoxin family protein
MWFDERGIDYHFIDLSVKPLSPGELKSIAARTSWSSMLDRDGKVWKSRQLNWKEFDPYEELKANPLLLKTPVVRGDSAVVIGYNPGALEVFRHS